MSIFAVCITLVVVGFILWLVNTYIPMNRKIKKVLNVVVIIVVILWLLDVFGIIGYLSTMHIGNMHTGL